MRKYRNAIFRASIQNLTPGIRVERSKEVLEFTLPVFPNSLRSLLSKLFLYFLNNGVSRVIRRIKKGAGQAICDSVPMTSDILDGNV